MRKVFIYYKMVRYVFNNFKDEWSWGGDGR